MGNGTPRGVIFDLDGTVVDSGLDFQQMRQEMGLPPGTAILEAIQAMPEEQAERCRAILQVHETAGARRATVMPGVERLLARLAEHMVPAAIVTRNTRRLTLETLDRLGLVFDPVITRDDAPSKPDPECLWLVCRRWQLPPAEVAMVGDFRHDIEAGQRAGTQTVLFAAQCTWSTDQMVSPPDHVVTHFAELEAIWFAHGTPA